MTSTKRKETVLVYNMEGGNKGRMVKLICMQMGIRIKTVDKSQYMKPIGELAGLKEITGQGQDESYEGEGFTDEMLIMCGLTGSRIDQLLDSFRRQKLERIALKEAISHLSERERHILDLRFFQGKTQMEVSAEVGISQAQVSRLEKNALDHMRKDL